MTTAPHSRYSCVMTISSDYYKAFNAVFITSSSRLNLSVQIQSVLHPCDPFLTNAGNMAGNSDEKHLLC